MLLTITFYRGLSAMNDFHAALNSDYVLQSKIVAKRTNGLNEIDIQIVGDERNEVIKLAVSIDPRVDFTETTIN